LLVFFFEEDMCLVNHAVTADWRSCSLQYSLSPLIGEPFLAINTRLEVTGER
jgi:hypothetical protein